MSKQNYEFVICIINRKYEHDLTELKTYIKRYATPRYGNISRFA